MIIADYCGSAETKKRLSSFYTTTLVAIVIIHIIINCTDQIVLDLCFIKPTYHQYPSSFTGQRHIITVWLDCHTHKKLKLKQQ